MPSSTGLACQYNKPQRAMRTTRHTLVHVRVTGLPMNPAAQDTRQVWPTAFFTQSPVYGDDSVMAGHATAALT
jgi:hypothetical protein